MELAQRLLTQSGVIGSLQRLGAEPNRAYSRDELEALVGSVQADQPNLVVDTLLSHSLIVAYGGRLGLSTAGQRASLLLEAFDGGDIEDVCRRLRRLSGHPEMYQLVQEGMTTAFFESLIERPGFQRLFICSPWINPTERDASKLRWAILRALESQEDAPEILVIARPRDMWPPGMGNGLKVLREVGAQISLNRKLHTKLYIREPDRRGGVPMAVVGSQNLTRATNIELGIRINGDSRLIDQLIRYFLELMNRSFDTDTMED